MTETERLGHFGLLVQRIYVVDDGTVIQHGTYDELMTFPDGRFARLFAAQHE